MRLHLFFCMNKWKRFWFNIFHPHGGWLCLFYFIFLLLVVVNIYTIVVQPFIPFISYILYGITAVCFIYFLYSIFYICPKISYWVTSTMKKFKFTTLMIENYSFKTAVFACIGIVLNFGFLIFIGVLAIKSKSIWYGTLTMYYMLLTLMSCIIVTSKAIDAKFKRKPKKAELTAYRCTGVLLLILTAAFGLMVALTFKALNEIQFAGVMIYVTAGYTAIKLTLGIISSLRARFEGDYYAKAVKNINLASAFVSLYSLQVLLLATFAPNTVNQTISNVTTGVVMIALVLSLGVYMIINSTVIKFNIKKKRALKIKEYQEQNKIEKRLVNSLFYYA